RGRGSLGASIRTAPRRGPRGRRLRGTTRIPSRRWRFHLPLVNSVAGGSRRGALCTERRLSGGHPVSDTSLVQALKLEIIATTRLSKDALHVYFGLIVWLLAAAL